MGLRQNCGETQVLKFKLSIGQAKPKWIPGFHVELIKVSVIEVEAFVKIGLWYYGVWIVHNPSVRSILIKALYDRIWKPSRSIDASEEDIDKSITTFLAGQMSEEDGFDVRKVCPFFD